MRRRFVHDVVEPDRETHRVGVLHPAGGKIGLAQAVPEVLGGGSDAGSAKRTAQRVGPQRPGIGVVQPDAAHPGRELRGCRRDRDCPRPRPIERSPAAPAARSSRDQPQHGSPVGAGRARSSGQRPTSARPRKPAGAGQSAPPRAASRASGYYPKTTVTRRRRERSFESPAQVSDSALQEQVPAGQGVSALPGSSRSNVERARRVARRPWTMQYSPGSSRVRRRRIDSLQRAAQHPLAVFVLAGDRERMAGVLEPA